MNTYVEEILGCDIGKPTLGSPLETVLCVSPEYPLNRREIPDIGFSYGRYMVRFATSREELDQILRLRFTVFNLELGEGLEPSFLTGRDEDKFDRSCHHLLVVDRTSGEIAGTYRLRTVELANGADDFYSAGEFDLACLPPGYLEEAVELGRVCIAREHRNKQVLFLLFKGLASYLTHNRKRYMFGCCSLPTQDRLEGARALRHLERTRSIHPEFSVPPLEGFECIADADTSASGEKVSLPALFQCYLRFGARICGLPAIDRAFKTIDFFVSFDVSEIDSRARKMYFE
jgi:putative hemolysin